MSRHVRTCDDPIPISEGARIVGRHPRTLERWAFKGRLTIYRDDMTLTRFVSKSEMETLAPNGGKKHAQALAVLEREILWANRMGFTSVAGKLREVRDEIAGLLG